MKSSMERPPDQARRGVLLVGRVKGRGEGWRLTGPDVCTLFSEERAVVLPF